MPRLIGPVRIGCGCRMLSVSGPRTEAGSQLRRFDPQALPVDPALFSVFATPRSRRIDGAYPSTQRSNAKLGSPRPISAHYPVRRSPPFQGRQALGPCLVRPAECSSGTRLGASGGTQLNSRRPGRTLGQTRPTRQGIVRVPESNTKYGGKRGITGGDLAPVIGPSISESSQIRQGKKCCGPVERRLLPAVHRTSIYSPVPGLPGLRF